MPSQRLAVDLALLTMLVRGIEVTLAGETMERGLTIVLWSTVLAFTAGWAAAEVLRALARERAVQIETPPPVPTD